MTLEERVAALEARLDREAALRQAADRDMTSAVRAVRHVVQAVSITQTEHTEVLRRQDEMLLRLTSDLGEVLRMLERLASGADE